MTISDYIETLLDDNFNLKEGEPLRWYVLAAAFCVSKATDRVIETVARILQVDETDLRKQLEQYDIDEG